MKKYIYLTKMYFYYMCYVDAKNKNFSDTVIRLFSIKYNTYNRKYLNYF